jgi:hypothetical protein
MKRIFGYLLGVVLFLLPFSCASYANGPIPVPICPECCVGPHCNVSISPLVVQ